MNEIIPNNVKLKSFSDNFLNEFTKSVEENYRLKRLGMVIGHFVWLRYNYSRGSFEMVGPMSKVNAHISYIDEVVEAGVFLENGFEMTLQELVGTGS